MKVLRLAVATTVITAVAIAAGPIKSEPSRDDAMISLGSVTSFAARNRTAIEVQRKLGAPNYRLSPELWVYWDCESSASSDVAKGFNAMILRFAAGRVAGIRLARRADVEKLIAQMEATKRREPQASRAN